MCGNFLACEPERGEWLASLRFVDFFPGRDAGEVLRSEGRSIVCQLGKRTAMPMNGSRCDIYVRGRTEDKRARVQPPCRARAGASSAPNAVATGNELTLAEPLRGRVILCHRGRRFGHNRNPRLLPEAANTPAIEVRCHKAIPPSDDIHHLVDR